MSVKNKKNSFKLYLQTYHLDNVNAPTSIRFLPFGHPVLKEKRCRRRRKKDDEEAEKKITKKKKKKRKMKIFLVSEERKKKK